ncbi:MAG: DUF4147 domain-containing protein [Acidimicrobiia bacterium]|nr:DUF4147 domain-containing protein [Acidimicrobiia bacterium]
MELQSLAEFAVAAADPESATRQAVEELAIEGPVAVLAVGKAAGVMAAGAHAELDSVTEGLVVTAYDDVAAPPGWSRLVASHPMPSDKSEAAGRAALDLVERATGTLVVLLSGGASALMEVPPAGLSTDDLAKMTSVLLASAMEIDDINVIRKHVSAVKGGRLAAASRASTIRTLAVSDVVGDDLSAIGSGPTVGDPSTFLEALTLAAPLRDRLPPAVYAHLEKGARGVIPETPVSFHADVTARVILSGRTVAKAVEVEAQRRGWMTAVHEPPLSGEAVNAVERVLAEAQPGLSVFHGETTLEVSGGGRGGRNQHGALAGALRLRGDERRTLMTLATDGVDGPTDAAGAIVDGGTVGRGSAAGLDAVEHLTNCNSGPYLEAAGDLLVTGATGTNVADLWMLFTVD